MPPAIKLTARQQQILELVQQAIANTGAPPTRAEIARELGYKSANAAEEHLQALARKGMIELLSGTSRGIRLRQSAVVPAAVPGAIAIDEADLTLPLVGRVAAGTPILAQEHVDCTYQVTSALFRVRPDYLLKVRGMSMRDIGILDGDLLAVRATPDAHNGQIVVARMGDEVTVKRYEKLPTHIALHAENPDYPTIVVQPGDVFAIEGVAVGLIRNSVLL